MNDHLEFFTNVIFLSIIFIIIRLILKFCLYDLVMRNLKIDSYINLEDRKFRSE